MCPVAQSVWRSYSGPEGQNKSDISPVMIHCCLFMWAGVLFLLSGPLYLPSVKLMSCSDEAFLVLRVEICFWLLRREKRYLTEPSCWTWATWRLWKSMTTGASCSVMWTWSPWTTATPTSVSVSLDTCLCPWTSLPSGESTPHLSSVWRKSKKAKLLQDCAIIKDWISILPSNDYKSAIIVKTMRFLHSIYMSML